MSRQQIDTHHDQCKHKRAARGSAAELPISEKLSKTTEQCTKAAARKPELPQVSLHGTARRPVAHPVEEGTSGKSVHPTPLPTETPRRQGCLFQNSEERWIKEKNQTSLL